MKRKSHVALNYKGNGLHLFCFQLVHDDGYAHAVVDFTNGNVDRVLVTPEYEGKGAAIVRLATIWMNKSAGQMS